MQSCLQGYETLVYFYGCEGYCDQNWNKIELLCELKKKKKKNEIKATHLGSLLAWRVDSASLKEQGPALGLKICELLE